jgi:hypothetical protein
MLQPLSVWKSAAHKKVELLLLHQHLHIIRMVHILPCGVVSQQSLRILVLALESLWCEKGKVWQ